MPAAGFGSSANVLCPEVHADGSEYVLISLLLLKIVGMQCNPSKIALFFA